MTGYMYILKCGDGSYYTGSTNDLKLRLAQHQCGEGANFTRKHLPVELVYFEEFQRIDDAFYREKQVQGWSRKKKEALINGQFDKLTDLAKNYMQYPRNVASTGSATEGSSANGSSSATEGSSANGSSSANEDSSANGSVVEPVETTETTETTNSKNKQL